LTVAAALLFCVCAHADDTPEQNVSPTKPGLSPAERVQEAVGCLPARLESTLAADSPGRLRRWTVRDFHDAYRSGETTPVQVGNNEWSSVSDEKQQQQQL
jgi:hypothetical protein